MRECEVATVIWSFQFGKPIEIWFSYLLNDVRFLGFHFIFHLNKSVLPYLGRGRTLWSTSDYCWFITVLRLPSSFLVLSWNSKRRKIGCKLQSIEWSLRFARSSTIKRTKETMSLACRKENVVIWSLLVFFPSSSKAFCSRLYYSHVFSTLKVPR